MSPNDSDHALSELLSFVREQRGIDFSVYKEASLKRRIGKRMEAVGAEDYQAYLDHLQATPDEFGSLLDTIFINVTRFFRDAEAWDTLRERLPSLLERTGPGSQLRVWCAGTASGEEAYSVAMLLAEEMGLEAFTERAKIFATDADENVLVRARAGRYGEAALEDVPEELRETYFLSSDRSAYRVRPDLRRAIIFGHHDLLEDAPISHLHLLVCRNTLMYFNREAQGRVLGRFHFALRPEGILFMGTAEMLLTRRSLFEPLEGKARIFRKVPDLSFRDRLSIVTTAEEDGGGGPGGTREAELRDLVFEASPVPEVVVDSGGTVAMVNARAREVLGLERGVVGRPFRDLRLSYRPVDLRSPIEEVMEDRVTSVFRDVEWEDAGAEGVAYFDIRVVPLFADGDTAVSVSLQFLDVTRYQELAEDLKRSKEELETAYGKLQSTNEELETTNEELQSTNEELETTNEELHSTNEELETMNEELQSTNAEIQAMNDELQRRTWELDRMNTYVNAILDSVQMGVVVLDEALDIRLWNEIAEESWGLSGPEVEGKAFLSLDIGLPVGELKEAMLRCLREGSEQENLRVEGHDRRGRPVDYEVRCVPLRHPDEEEDVSGVILLMDGGRGEPGRGIGIGR